jgi:hypothetical protein
MTPEQVIQEVETNDFCRIKHRTYLWKTSEAAPAIRVETKEPYILIEDGDWCVPKGVRGAGDKKLIEACNA